MLKARNLLLFLLTISLIVLMSTSCKRKAKQTAREETIDIPDIMPKGQPVEMPSAPESVEGAPTEAEAVTPTEPSPAEEMPVSPAPEETGTELAPTPESAASETPPDAGTVNP